MQLPPRFVTSRQRARTFIFGLTPKAKAAHEAKRRLRLRYPLFRTSPGHELDGGVHSQINQMRRDAAKEDHLQALGITLLRIPNGEVLEDPEGFVRKVRPALDPGAATAKVTPHPSRASSQGRWPRSTLSPGESV